MILLNYVKGVIIIIDIIIPTIDAPDLVERALMSIQNTTSDLSKIHIYLINDCSKYDYNETVLKFNDLDITLLKTKERSGPGPARNLGIKAGKSFYISFLDADDIFTDDIFNFCTSYKYDCISTRVILKTEEAYRFSHEDSFIEGIHGLIVSRKILEKYNLYFPDIRKSSSSS